MNNKKHVLFNYDKITEHIYLGSNQCCLTHFRKSLLNKKIKADISLEEEKLDMPFGADYFLWVPVKDKMAPSQEKLLIGAKAIKNFVENNIRIYVHCRNGHGRSPTLVAAYFILQGMKTDEAIRKIKEKRFIHPTNVQIGALRKFEKSVRKGEH